MDKAKVPVGLIPQERFSMDVTAEIAVGKQEYRRKMEVAAREKLAWWEKKIAKATRKGYNMVSNELRVKWCEFLIWLPKETSDEYVEALQSLLGPKVTVKRVWGGPNGAPNYLEVTWE